MRKTWLKQRFKINEIETTLKYLFDLFPIKRIKILKEVKLVKMKKKRKVDNLKQQISQMIKAFNNLKMKNLS